MDCCGGLPFISTTTNCEGWPGGTVDVFAMVRNIRKSLIDSQLTWPISNSLLSSKEHE